MSQFVSIHPLQRGHVNRVKPGVVPAYCACGRLAMDIRVHWATLVHNEPNMILTMLREAVKDGVDGWDESEDADGPWENRYQLWLQYVVNGDFDPEERYPSPEEFAHAEKVLRRLIALDNQDAWV